MEGPDSCLQDLPSRMCGRSWEHLHHLWLVLCAGLEYAWWLNMGSSLISLTFESDSVFRRKQRERAGERVRGNQQPIGAIKSSFMGEWGIVEGQQDWLWLGPHIPPYKVHLHFHQLDPMLLLPPTPAAEDQRLPGLPDAA